MKSQRMENQKVKKGQVKQSIQLVKPRDYSESEGMILKWISLLDLHYRAGLSAQEKLSYVAALREYNAKRLDESFSIAMKECEFLPRAADIVKRLPVERPRAYEDGLHFGWDIERDSHGRLPRVKR